MNISHWKKDNETEAIKRSVIEIMSNMVQAWDP